MVAEVPLQERFGHLVCGRWSDSIGNSITVTFSSDSDTTLTAVLTPLATHPLASSRAITIQRGDDKSWRCGNALLEGADEHHQRLVWITKDGRRVVWSRSKAEGEQSAAVARTDRVAFPWLLAKVPENDPDSQQDIPADIRHDAARIVALLDIRQMIGVRRELQERLTHILMDHDLHPGRGDYLVPGAESPLWQTLPVTEAQRRGITDRIRRIPHEATLHSVSWSSDSNESEMTEIRVGHHRIDMRNRQRDVQALDVRWACSEMFGDDRKLIEIARLLALYSVFDNPLSHYRSGMHLGLDPELRICCDYELFASPLNAVVPNGYFASKWPHIEWRFGSLGSYPSVLSVLPVEACVCVNPPFTEAYLADVMARIGELKLRFRIRLAVPIQDVPWRKKLQKALPCAQLLHTYYDATNEAPAETLHPTLLWEDPRCPQRWTNDKLPNHLKIGPLTS